MEVAMAIFYYSFSYSLIKQACVAVNEAISVILNMLIFLGDDGNSNIFLGLSEVLIGIVANNT